MAIGISESELEKYRFPNSALRHLLIKAYRFRFIFRRLLLFLEPKSKSINSEISIILSQSLEKGAEKFNKQGWVFLENIFPADVHELLVQEWPNFYHFHPARNIHKSYDLHFISPTQTISKYPVIEDFQKYLSSGEFSKRLNDFTQSLSSERIIDKILYSRAGYKSSCINHLDSVSTSKINKNESINFLFFVKGTGGSGSGGTCIYHDKNGEILFETKNTTNSCLIYRSDSMYHGFPPMKFGKNRWMVSCHAQVISKKLD
jgi:hypothetical protein